MSNNSRTHLEDQISAAAPAALSAVEEAALLESVRARVGAQAVPSSFIPSFISYPKPMISLALILALLLGAGGTAAASDNARPGDLLFPVDRAIEDLRLSIAPEKEKQELRIRFADERLREFDSIVDDEVGDDDAEGTLSEAEADIFTNETIVKIEVGNRTTVFTTDANTRDEIIDVIVDRYGFTRADVDAVLSVESEDRESTTEDRGDTHEASKKLENALDVLGEFIERNRDAASTSPEVLTALALIESRLIERSAWFPEEVRVKVRDDRARYEVRGENGERIRVEMKDGEVRVKTKDHDDEDEDESDDSDDDDRNRVGTTTSAGFLQVEADVFTDTTIVKVELAGKTTVFTTDADTRSEIVDEVEDRFSALSKAQIDAVLDFEVEDRASRAQDLSAGGSEDDEEDDSDDSDDDSSGHHSGSDDDEDDDSSGHGGSDDDEDDEDDDSSGKNDEEDDD